MLDDDALSIGIHVAGSVINQVSLHRQVLVTNIQKLEDGWTKNSKMRLWQYAHAGGLSTQGSSWIRTTPVLYIGPIGNLKSQTGLPSRPLPPIHKPYPSLLCLYSNIGAILAQPTTPTAPYRVVPYAMQTHASNSAL